ncbi:MAG: excinuclease ABC subunit UvrA, partial [Flavobacteriales bacterium]|nr:excinuclease ABC subunit UvrA [Flavobacteriales bacterium]
MAQDVYPSLQDERIIRVERAGENNLQDIDVTIPRNKLVVITGVSGSGKSSLAFDTLHAEGQRRYLETFSAYARQFMGGLERPKVERITGLSPVIAIEQKTISRNPRSTVGTVTELLDFLRVLFARAATAYSSATGEPMVRFTDEGILARIAQDHAGERLLLLAPLVRGRKGHYRELFESIQKQGYLRARVDGEVVELEPGYRVDRYKVHDIEVVVDRIVMPEVPALDDEGKPADEETERVMRSVRTALAMGKGSMMVLPVDDAIPRHFSRALMCPTTGISYPEPEPNLFSFNSPYGACPSCNGLGQVAEADR